MTKKYRVVFLGLVGSEGVFREGMSKLGVAAATIDQIMHKAPIILKGQMTLREARQYAEAVQLAGGRVNIQEHGLFEEPERSFPVKPLENFVMCPECGYKQLKEKACVKCGYPFEPGKTGQA